MAWREYIMLSLTLIPSTVYRLIGCSLILEGERTTKFGGKLW
jgi:hypothetical protein